MSGSPEAVKAFMDPLLAKVKEGAARDLERLKGLKGGDLEASDVSFYSAKLLKESYARRGVPGIFVRRHAIAAASSRCLIRAGRRPRGGTSLFPPGPRRTNDARDLPGIARLGIY